MAALLPPVFVARAGDLYFSDQTRASGLVAQHIHGTDNYPHEYYEQMLAGASAGDFNNDGWQDVYVATGGGAPDKFFINNGDGRFTDQAQQWGIAVSHLGAGASVGDYDGDGWLDLYVTSFGPPGEQTFPGMHKLYRNNGDGTFTDVATAAGVHQTSVGFADGTGSAFGDFDLDGDLDLAVAGWQFGSTGNVIFRNEGDGTFTKVTLAMLDHELTFVNGFSPRFCDTDGDRYPDLMWVSDFGTSKYFINDGGLAFIEVTDAANVGQDLNGMGTTIGDFNNDLKIDWYVSAIDYRVDQSLPSGNKLYLNGGDHYFRETAEYVGVRHGGWGWGTVAVDLDNDGDMDIVETNGWDLHDYDTLPSVVFLNNGIGKFHEGAAQVGFIHNGNGRAMFNFDYDNDGDQDIVIFENRGELRLFRNDLMPENANWLRLLLDTSNNDELAPNGFGTRVDISANGKQQMRYLDGGCNYLSQSELAVHFGVGAASRIDTVRIHWASGQRTLLRDVPANQTMTVYAPAAP